MVLIGTGGRFTNGAGLSAWVGLREKGLCWAVFNINHPGIYSPMALKLFLHQVQKEYTSPARLNQTPPVQDCLYSVYKRPGLRQSDEEDGTKMHCGRASQLENPNLDIRFLRGSGQVGASATEVVPRPPVYRYDATEQAYRMPLHESKFFDNINCLSWNPGPERQGQNIALFMGRFGFVMLQAGVSKVF